MRAPAAVSRETCGSPSDSLNNSAGVRANVCVDANPNKSAAVGGHSLRCLRVLAQTCLTCPVPQMFIQLPRETRLHKEGKRTRAGTRTHPTAGCIAAGQYGSIRTIIDNHDAALPGPLEVKYQHMAVEKN